MVGRRNLDLTVQGNVYTVELHLTALHPMYQFWIIQGFSWCRINKAPDLKK